MEKMTEKDMAFVKRFSEFVNGEMCSPYRVGKALAEDHRYLIGQKAEVMFAFLEELGRCWEAGYYDERDAWACHLAFEAMEHLVQTTTVIYLQLSLEALAQRLGDLRHRGVVLRKGQSLEELYEERVPLYRQYAHITIDCEKKDISGIVEEIAAILLH